MVIEIGKRDGRYHAMGHSVPIDEGAESELRRRCFESLSRLNLPPDEVRFKRLWVVEPSLPDTLPPGPRITEPRIPEPRTAARPADAAVPVAAAPQTASRRRR